MRKTFQLQVEGKNPDRVLDAVKHEIRKYIKRERRRESRGARRKRCHPKRRNTLRENT